MSDDETIADRLREQRLEEDDQAPDEDTDGTDGDAEADQDAAAADADDEEDADAPTDPDDEAGDDRMKPVQIARLAVQHLRELTGRTVEGVTGIDRDGDGWRVTLEVLEVERVPRGTDVLGLYEVLVDADGDLTSYERIQRYTRASAGEGGP